MIKANELRLNNWISITGLHIHLNDPIKLAFIFEEDGLETRCAGIPLNEEWLLRGGFIKQDHLEDNTWYQLDEDMVMVSDRVYIDGNEFDYNTMTVHRLQNIYFALYEKELEFK